MMTWSLRAMMGITALVALAFFAQRNIHRERQLQQILAVKQSLIDQDERSMGLDHPEYRKALRHEVNQWPELIDLQDQAIEHYQVIALKQGHLKPRSPDVLSLRMLPRPPRESARRPIVYRMTVPEQDKVWFKIGVKDLAIDSNETNLPANLDGRVSFMNGSSLAALGPFEVELLPGEHILELHIHWEREADVHIRVKLDQRTLWKTRYSATFTTGLEMLSTSVNQQDDFESNADLPWLASRTFNVRGDDGELEGQHQLTAWLSRRSSGFAEFPGGGAPMVLRAAGQTP